MASYANCFEVSEQCPVTSTALGYTPSLPANVTLLAIFSVVGIVHLIQGAAWKTWGFMIALVLGSLVEAFGYFARLILNTNPWSRPGLMAQMFCLMIGPIFYSAGIYLCYTHLVESFQPTHSRINPKIYPLISASANILPFLLQASGSVLAANAILTGGDPKTGTNLAIIGLVFQIFTLLFFGVLCLDFGVRAHLGRHSIDPWTKGERSLKRFKCFWVALANSYVLIIIRCIYRVIELSGGAQWWSNSGLARNEVEFIALEGVMVLAAVFALSILHPGYVFKSGREGKMENLSDDEEHIL